MFENEDDRKIHTAYYLPKVEIKDCNVMIDGKNVFDQPVKYKMRTYDNIRKIETGQGDDYTIGCSLDHNYFNKHYKLIAIDLSKKKALQVDPKSIQKINFTGILEEDEGAALFFIIEEAKETTLDFSKGLMKVLGIYFTLIKYLDKMTQYSTWNVKLSNLKLNKLKWEVKSGTEVTLKLSSNVLGDSNDENNFPRKLLFTNTQVLRLRKAFANNP